MTEAQLQRAAIETAQLYGWHVAHFRPALTERGWRTAVEANGAGFPDLVLVHPAGVLLARELKAERGRTTPAQDLWLELLQRAGVDAAIWTPAEWDSGAIAAELSAPKTGGR